MLPITLRLAEPEKDFVQLAAWFSLLEDEPSTDASLQEYYQKEHGRITQRVAVGAQGELAGFYWAERHKFRTGEYTFFLYTRPEMRWQGVGRRLYAEMLQGLQEALAKKLLVSVRDDSPEARTFAERRGFSEKRYHFMMGLDLEAFDDRPYQTVIDRLEGEGFQFTSMEALGNTEEAQRRLYALNDAAAASTPGVEGKHSWESFEDFQKSVCQADWYKPGGQMVVIDSLSGEWAAMSAITRLEGNAYAYNLFTGVDERYRGRKLGQAAKVCALRYAREVLGVKQVRTHHNTRNLPMIAIDRKFGYVQMPGTYLMEKLSE
jgi:RimJ/RimL family protein N-acetyltransferase/ribosomal protein S18 acetylase RimI-like enzyme